MTSPSARGLSVNGMNIASLQINSLSVSLLRLSICPRVAPSRPLSFLPLDLPLLPELPMAFLFMQVC